MHVAMNILYITEQTKLPRKLIRISPIPPEPASYIYKRRYLTTLLPTIAVFFLLCRVVLWLLYKVCNCLFCLYLNAKIEISHLIRLWWILTRQVQANRNTGNICIGEHVIFFTQYCIVSSLTSMMTNFLRNLRVLLATLFLCLQFKNPLPR